MSYYAIIKNNKLIDLKEDAKEATLVFLEKEAHEMRRVHNLEELKCLVEGEKSLTNLAEELAKRLDEKLGEAGTHIAKSLRGKAQKLADLANTCAREVTAGWEKAKAEIEEELEKRRKGRNGEEDETEQ